MSAQVKRERLDQLEQDAERAYDAMYEARFGTAGHYSDAKDYLADAIALAREIGLHDDAERLERRLEHIKRVYRSQFL
jgi:hypothetical protein